MLFKFLKGIIALSYARMHLTKEYKYFIIIVVGHLVAISGATTCLVS